MAKKIYVGNLNYATQEEHLREAFEQYGTVNSVSIIYDRMTNRSKGFGFVEMEESDAATAAISSLNGSELNNRDMRVSEAKERAPRQQRYSNNY
ncbi:MAG: RNA-binding protein [Spirochaetales bacterium]|nr:RNA-binding protein [Spirochaetales bacterium]